MAEILQIRRKTLSNQSISNIFCPWAGMLNVAPCQKEQPPLHTKKRFTEYFLELVIS